MSSIKALKKNLKEDSEILSVTRKEYSLPLSQKKLTDLTEVVRDFVSAENFFLKNFSGIQGLCHIAYPRKLRDRYVQGGLPEDLGKIGLQDRQWKMALDIAFDTIKSSHAKTTEEVKISLNRSFSLSNSEKHLVRYILQRPLLLHSICMGEFKNAEEILGSDSQSLKFNPTLRDSLYKKQGKIADIRIKKVFTWLRRRYRKLHSKHQRPLIRKNRTYHLDSSMFTFFQNKERCYISVASKTPRHRIIIPLTNPDLMAKDFLGNVKVVLRKDGKVEVHRTINSITPKVQIVKEDVIKASDQFKITALDKGLKTLIHTDEDKKYGGGYSEKFLKWSDELTKSNAGRAQFHSLTQKLTENLKRVKTPQVRENIQKKIIRIQENNLGDLKVTRKREYIKQEIKKEIGTAVNSFFKNEKPNVLVVENLKFISFKNLGRRTNRLLNSWSKGVLRDALELGAKKNGVLLEEINAAYSSQQCRNCFYVHRKNRQGDVFDCACCGHKADADFAAALNIRDRFFDSEISVKTPVKEVKEILLKRNRVRLSTQGLNERPLRPSSANHRNVD